MILRWYYSEKAISFQFSDNHYLDCFLKYVENDFETYFSEKIFKNVDFEKYQLFKIIDQQSVSKAAP